MSVQIKVAHMKYKDSQGNYVGVNSVAERAASEQITSIQNAGAAAVSHVQQTVANSQAAVAILDTQRSNIIEEIASVAGQSTDDTLSQSGVAADAAAVGELIKTAVNSLDHRADAAKIHTTVSTPADVITIEDGADGIPVDELVVEIEPMQSGSGDPAPDNVRPISGWTGANVIRKGGNLWDEQTRNGYYDPTTGEFKSFSNQIANLNKIYVLPDHDYYITPVTGEFRLVYRDASGEKLNIVSNFTGGTFRTPANCYYLDFNLYTVYGRAYNHDISINYPSTDTDYHPGNVQTVAVGFPSEAGTVYGGTLTINKDGSGSLVVDRAIVHLKDKTWEKQGTLNQNGTVYQAITPIVFAGWADGGSTDAISDVLKKSQSASFSDSENGTFWWNTARTGYRAVWGQSNDGSTIEEFNSFLAQNDPIVCGKLYITTAYNLTAIEVLETLKGLNHIFADTGAIQSLTYSADPKLYIDHKITQAVAAALNA